MGKMSLDKGKRGEREVAELLRSFGFEAARGVQYQGSPGSPDVVHNLPGGLHVEVKRAETFRPYWAIGQAIEDAGHNRVVVFHRRMAGEWLITMPAASFLALLAAHKNEEAP